MGVVESFLEHYLKEHDFYDRSARLVAQQLESHLQASGIRAIVTSRAKKPASLERKLRQRSLKRKGYKDVKAIYSDLADLAGARVGLYFPSDREEVDKIVNSIFILTESKKEFPASSKPTPQKRFSGYWATHYRVQLRDASLSDAEKRYAAARVEIQVASVLMHAWSEVEHDLVYKPAHGTLSIDEYAILDELNGLVLSGEIALERLQRAVKARVGRDDTPFGNHYELAAHLSEAAKSVLKSPVAEAELGQVSLLFELLRKVERATPRALAPYLASLHADTEKRPIAEQIVDQVLASNKPLYDVYARIRQQLKKLTTLEAKGKVAKETANRAALGYFMSQWIAFEVALRRLAQKRGFFANAPLGLNLSAMMKALPRGKTMLAEIDRIRRLRNQTVHGGDTPNAETLDEAAKTLQRITKTLSPKGLSRKRRK